MFPQKCLPQPYWMPLVLSRLLQQKGKWAKMGPWDCVFTCGNTLGSLPKLSSASGISCLESDAVGWCHISGSFCGQFLLRPSPSITQCCHLDSLFIQDSGKSQMKLTITMQCRFPHQSKLWIPFESPKDVLSVYITTFSFLIVGHTSAFLPSFLPRTDPGG